MAGQTLSASEDGSESVLNDRSACCLMGIHMTKVPVKDVNYLNTLHQEQVDMIKHYMCLLNNRSAWCQIGVHVTYFVTKQTDHLHTFKMPDAVMLHQKQMDIIRQYMYPLNSRLAWGQ